MSRNQPFLAEDFWNRQTNAQTETFEFTPFGHPARITANRAEVLAAAHLSARRFSRADVTAEPPLDVKLVVRPGDTPPLPPDLPAWLVYSGVGRWLTVSAGEWGHAFANLTTREAVIVLSPALAADTRLVSRYFIDHYLLNFLLTEWAMLHASAVVSPDGRRLAALVAPHNTGKSTTALQLLRAGYRFLADGMVLLRPAETGFVVGGYPIGEVKLRDDVLSLFPEYSGLPVQVREQRKTVVDVRAAHPDGLAELVFRPETIDLYFVERSGTDRTTVSPLTPAEFWPLLAGNSVFWDEPERLRFNHDILHDVLRAARLRHLTLGSETTEIIAAIGQ